ncbi:lipopolysaccharide kinase InaA family protein [Nonomuraea angiospora]|uniref:protein kinase domain-containing protein n=1 Tax=Nonomuraea angiospora TaxID=46172 RepID=UPI0033EE35F3
MIRLKEESVWATFGSRMVVRQEDGTALELTRKLGAGGQGEVWAAGRRRAVKLLHAPSQKAALELHRRLRLVRRLDLAGLPISSPLAVLAPPNLGYVMELLEDMVSIQTLSSPPRAGDLLQWYARTGGLRRRLRLLARLAGALAALHGRGMAYGDLSPLNVLVSEPIEHEQVWLIDVDNVAVESQIRDHAVMTPGYAAPEVSSGKGGVSSLSDAYGFAVLAFETLAITHPFLGDLVEDGPPGLQAKAFAGEMPWIDHPEDMSNRSSYGLDRDLVLTPGLTKLAKATFVDTLHEPVSRPTVGEWRLKLNEAADMTLECAGCAGTFYANRASCPWCGAAAAQALLARSQVYVPADDVVSSRLVDRNEALVVQKGTPIVVTARTVLLDHDDPERSVAVLTWQTDGRLVVRNLWDRPLWLSPPGGDQIVPVEPRTESAVPGRSGAPTWVLRFGIDREAHRLLTFVKIAR